MLVRGCQTGTVVLLPEKDGKETAVVVKQRDGEVTLREPYAAANFSNTGPAAYQSSEDDVGRAIRRRARRASERPWSSRCTSSRARTSSPTSPGKS
jgi:hypothetical protein